MAIIIEQLFGFQNTKTGVYTKRSSLEGTKLEGTLKVMGRVVHKINGYEEVYHVYQLEQELCLFMFLAIKCKKGP